MPFLELGVADGLRAGLERGGADDDERVRPAGGGVGRVGHAGGVDVDRRVGRILAADEELVVDPARTLGEHQDVVRQGIPGPIAGELDGEERRGGLGLPLPEVGHLVREPLAAAEHPEGVDVIGVGDDDPGGDRPRRRGDARDPPLRVELDRLDLDARVDVDPDVAAGRGDRPGDGGDAPFGRIPDPLADDRPWDDRQARRRLLGVEARVGREAVEQLADRRRAELLVDLLGVALGGRDQGGGDHQRGQHDLAPVLEHPVAIGVGDQLGEAVHLLEEFVQVRPVGRVDRGEGVAEPGGVAGDVEGPAVGEHDAERRVEPVHLEVAVRVEPAGLEQGPIDPGHHDDARPLVPPIAALGPLARLAPELGVTLQDDDLVAAPLQFQGRRQAAQPPADHHRPSRRHGCPISSCVRTVAVSSM